MVSYLRWLRQEEPSVAKVLGVAVVILLASAPGFAASEVAALSTVQTVNAQRPAIVHLSAGTYDISQDIGDNDFPADSTELSITGPGGPVPIRTLPQVLRLGDEAKAFLGEWDCYPVMSFAIRQAGAYRVSINDRYGMSNAWISEPPAQVARQVFPWSTGILAALLTIALCLMVPRSRWHRIRWAGSPSAATTCPPPASWADSSGKL